MIDLLRYLSVVRQSDQDITRAAEGAFQRLLELIRAGQTPQKAISQALREFNADTLVGLEKALSEVLQSSLGQQAIRDWKVGDVKLSDRLYDNAQKVSATTKTIITEHMKGVHRAEDLRKALYEGYDFQKDPLNVNAPLPKYLQGEFDRFKAMQLKTPALRAAYLEAIRKAESGAGMDALEKQLRIAFYERNRYFANRIARTELHRNYTDQQARDLMSQDRIEYVQWRLSSKHPHSCICDYHANVNLYGLGPGIYPKADAPKPPAHPFCLCVLSPVVNLVNQKPKFKPKAERQFLNSLPKNEARAVAGSAAKLQRALDGQPLEEIYNEGKDPLYQWKRIGDMEGFIERMDRMTREEKRAYQKSETLFPEALRQELFRMRDTAGWAEEGGQLLRDAEGNVTGRTKWTAKADWFADYKAMHGGKGLTSGEMPKVIDQMLKGKITKKGQDFLDWKANYDKEQQRLQQQFEIESQPLTEESRELLATIKNKFIATVGEAGESVVTAMTEEYYQKNPLATPYEANTYLINELKQWFEE